MLRGWIDNLQTSWVKLGTELAQLTLAAGCNDFGGTLMEESISKAAGADAGEYLPESEICALIRGGGPHSRATDNHLWPDLVDTASLNRVAVLAGGVGAARFLRGLRSLLDPARLTIIVNTADDETFFGLHVSPDLDTVTYTLAESGRPASGLGRRARHASPASTRCSASTPRPGSASATATSPRTSSAPTQLRRGRSLTRVTAAIAARHGVAPARPADERPAGAHARRGGRRRLAALPGISGQAARPRPRAPRALRRHRRRHARRRAC